MFCESDLPWCRLSWLRWSWRCSTWIECLLSSNLLGAARKKRSSSSKASGSPSAFTRFGTLGKITLKSIKLEMQDLRPKFFWQFAGGFDMETMKAFQELRDKARSCHEQFQNKQQKMVWSSASKLCFRRNRPYDIMLCFFFLHIEGKRMSTLLILYYFPRIELFISPVLKNRISPIGRKKPDKIIIYE